MATEIERKYLVRGDWQELITNGKTISQGFLSTDKERVVRVRVIGDDAFITVKGKTTGISKAEFEYGIPVQDAKEMLKMCKTTIEKVRYTVAYNDFVIEVDVFLGDNEGLVVAEVELKSEDQELNLPNWIGKEISSDFRYANSNLAIEPFKNWG